MKLSPAKGCQMPTSQIRDDAYYLDRMRPSIRPCTRIMWLGD